MKEYPFMRIRKIEVNLYCDKFLRILIIMTMTKEKLVMKNQKELSNGEIKIKIHNKSLISINKIVIKKHYKRRLAYQSLNNRAHFFKARLNEITFYISKELIRNTSMILKKKTS